MGKIRIGLSGWDYDEWDGVFYPDDLPKSRRLQWAGEKFDTIEINGTFYSLTSPDACRRWRDATPSHFVLSLKGSRYITHMKRLKEVDRPLANFFASGILELNEKLGPIVWQLPANLEFNSEKLNGFLEMLPKDTNSAIELAKGHDDRVDETAYGDGENHRVRHVLEVRHESFLQPEAARIATRHGVALCASHSSEWPYVEELTAGFMYVRLHGPGELYASGYSESDLDWWATRLCAWRAGDRTLDDNHRISDTTPPDRKERDVYVYFDNTAEGHAPRDATALRDRI